MRRLALALFSALLVFLTSACGGTDRQGGESGPADVPAEVPVDVPAEVAGAESLTDLAVEPTPDVPADPGAPEPDVPADPSLSCATLPRLGVAYDLLPGEPTTQIHGALAFDGAAVWVAYNVPDPDSSYFDVRVARLWCDGSYATSPARAHEDPLGNDIDPALALGASSALVVWASDTGGDPNLWLYARGYHLDGTPLADAERRIELAVDGAPVAASAWLPKVAALADGTFAVVGVWADPDASRWRAFLAILGADGSLLPPPGGQAPGLLRLEPEPDVDQAYPDVASDADGSIVVAWTRAVSDSESTIRAVRVAVDGTISQVEPGATGVSAGAALAAAPGHAAAPWLAWHRLDANAAIDLVHVGAEGGQPVSFGETWAFDHGPVVSATSAGGALAWYRVRNGMWNDVMIQGFDAAATGAAPRGPAVLLNPAEGDVSHAAPAVYGAALTHVRDRVFLAGWSEGASPDFRLVGRFVEVP